MYGVTYLYLLYSQVKECQFIPNRDETFGSSTAHAGPQTAVQLDEDARDVCMYGVTYLYLLYSQVKECQFIPHGDETFGSSTAHAGPQTAVQLDEDARDVCME